MDSASKPPNPTDVTLRGQLQSEVIRTMSCCARVLLEIERQCQKEMRLLVDAVQRNAGGGTSDTLLNELLAWAKEHGLSSRDGVPVWLVSCMTNSVPGWRLLKPEAQVTWARTGSTPYFHIAVGPGFLNALISSHGIYEKAGDSITGEDFNEPYYFYTTAYEVIIPSSRKKFQITSIGSGWGYHISLDGLSFDYDPEWQRRNEVLADILHQLKPLVEQKLIEVEKNVVAMNSAERAITGRRTFTLRSVRVGYRDRFDWLVKHTVLKQTYAQIREGVRSLSEASLRQQISNARREVLLGRSQTGPRR